PPQLQSMIEQIPAGANEKTRLTNIFRTFALRIDEVNELTRQITEEQQTYVSNVGFVRDEGPRVIQQMRGLRLDQVAADTFQLVVGTLDYATPRGTVQDYELSRLLDALSQDPGIDANMPREVERLGQAVNVILQSKRSLQSKLEQLAATPVAV